MSFPFSEAFVYPFTETRSTGNDVGKPPELCRIPPIRVLPIVLHIVT